MIYVCLVLRLTYQKEFTSVIPMSHDVKSNFPWNKLYISKNNSYLVVYSKHVK